MSTVKDEQKKALITALKAELKVVKKMLQECQKQSDKLYKKAEGLNTRLQKMVDREVN